MSESIIFGAGKIGRGFLARLLLLQNQQFCFYEKSYELANLLNSEQGYQIHVLGSPEDDLEVKGHVVYTQKGKDELVEKFISADTVFTSVGGANLESIIPIVVEGIKRRYAAKIEKPLNIITCENWIDPDGILRRGILQLLDDDQRHYVSRWVGIAESIVLCSGIEHEENPSSVNIQDTTELPINGKKLVQPFPAIPGLTIIEDFKGLLERKLYTYNAANATVSYLGSLLGYTYIYEASFDPFILKVLDGVYQETARALSRKHHIPLEEQIAFTKTSLAKLQNPDLVDTLERNARDPLRKLSPNDRLIGPARMVAEYGETPNSLALVIAAAAHYSNPEDISAVKLTELRNQKGLEAVLTEVCHIEEGSQLFKKILESEQVLKQEGVLHA